MELLSLTFFVLQNVGMFFVDHHALDTVVSKKTEKFETIKV